MPGEWRISAKYWSEWQDLNLRPLVPNEGAYYDLRAFLRTFALIKSRSVTIKGGKQEEKRKRSRITMFASAVLVRWSARSRCLMELISTKSMTVFAPHLAFLARPRNSVPVRSTILAVDA